MIFKPCQFISLKRTVSSRNREVATVIRETTLAYNQLVQFKQARLPQLTD